METTMRRLVRAAALVSLTALLAGCGPSRIEVRITSSDPDLRAALADTVKAFQTARGLGLALEVVPEGAPAPAAGVPVVGLGYRTRPPTAADAAGLTPLPAGFAAKNGVSWMVPLEAWVRDGGSAVPLLWDVWGVASGRFTGPVAWKTVATSPAGTILLAGGTPAARQLLWASSALEAGTPAVLVGLDRGTLAYRSPEARALFPTFLGWSKAPALYPQTLRFAQADLENLRKTATDTRLAFVESYHSFSPSGVTPVLKPLHFGADPAAYTLVGSVLAGWYAGPASGADRAFEFLAWLSSPAVQSSLAARTKLMPTNLATPRMNPTHAELGNDALRATALRVINPDPAGEPWARKLDDTLRIVQADPARWEAQLPAD